MTGKKYDVGACGKACFTCICYGKTCKGCSTELERHPGVNCVFSNCVKDKKVPNCLKCSEYPCKLHVGVSGLYCPLYRYKYVSDLGSWGAR